MISAHILAFSVPWTLLAASLVSAGDFSTYREFQFGMTLPAVVKLVGMNSSQAKVIHERPALIQDLDWQLGRHPGSSPDAGPVNDIRFSFCNGELFRMVVNYDRYKTEGLTAEDMIEGISAKYGTATRPTAEIILPSLLNEPVKVIARWEDSQYSFDLVPSFYGPGFAMVLCSKRLGALAQTAVTEALQLDAQEAPQREAERQRKQEEENRVKEEKVRLANKASFRP